jgi:cytochrome b subunit of formate dehydrogenase/ssDNA-binding Zn-finger/Zn-ribbon topoisomerase 1
MFPQRREKRSPIVPLILILFAAAAVLLPSSSWALDNGQCFDCHGDSGILKWSKEEMAGNVKEGGPKAAPRLYPPLPDVALHVDPALYKASVHADLSCTDCHADIQDLPHTARLKPVDCSGCHGNVVAVYAKSRHVLGHDRKPLAQGPRCVDCHGAHAIVKGSISTSPVSRRNVSHNCVRCHGKPALVPNAGIPGAGMMYEQSVHYKAILEKGLTRSAGCPDCHGTHDVRDRLDPAAPIFRPNIPVTCGKCHFGVLATYRESVHGKAFSRNVPDAPGCTDCHGEHEIRQATDPRSSVSFAAVSEKTCPSCHAAEKLSNRYGVSTDKVKGYQESFHGLSERLGDKTVANCASCHGTHEIFPSSDSRSTIHPRNLAVTCGKCHPGATENFAKGNIHVGPGGLGGQVKYWVEKVYIWMIVAVIGGMMVHNGADYVRKMQALYRKRREWEHPGYERMNSNERMQHVLTFTTFIILVITGFALKYKWSVPFVSDTANVWLRGTGHRVAAILMVATCIYHMFYVIFTARGRDQFVRMLPTIQDARDVMGTLEYFAGLADHKPKYARYSYVEKAEYLALVWGSIVMIVTGFLLWFQDEALRHIPMWGLDVATLVHYYEAILATLAIIVWHFYYVFVNPDFAPMAFTWIDGKLSRHEMEHEHALELEEIEERERRDEGEAKGSARTVTEES